MDTIDLTLLSTFREVVECGSMARAAERLGYVPSAVSQQITRLERSVGVQLLTRHPGEPVTPTAAGREVAAAAVDLLAAGADFLNACQSVVDGEVELRVAVFATAACELLPAAIAALQRSGSAPGVRMVQAEPDEGLAALSAGDVDLLIAYRYLPDDLPATPRISERVLAEERMPLVYPGNRRIHDANWIGGLPGSPSRRLLEHWAATDNRTLAVRYETEDPHTVLSLCAKGVGQGLVPISVLHSRRDLPVRHHDLKTVGRPLTRQVLALTRSRYSHPRADALCMQLQTILADADHHRR